MNCLGRKGDNARKRKQMEFEIFDCDESRFSEIVVCDWCEAEHPVRDMQGGEAGGWVCQECFDRDIEKNGHIGGSDNE